MLSDWVFAGQQNAWIIEAIECARVSLPLIDSLSHKLTLACRCYQLPDCSLNVQLLLDFHPRGYLNTTVEVFGEVRLYDESSSRLESSHSLINKLRSLQMQLEEEMGLPPRPPSGTNDKTMNSLVKCKLQKEIERFRKTYKPVIQVFTMRHIEEAREIIVENLHYRLIQKTRKARLNLK